MHGCMEPFVGPLHCPMLVLADFVMARCLMLHVMLQLDALVQKLFPAEHAQRMAELQASDWMLTAWSSQHANSPAPWQPTGAHDQLIATLASRLRRPVLASPNALRLPAPPASTGLHAQIMYVWCQALCMGR